MKRPWQIWSLYLLCLTLVVGALGWLSAKVVELDKAEINAHKEARTAQRQAAAAFREAELSRRQADLQERISNALWRMDWTLTPLVAQEAARPYFVYQPFYSANINTLPSKVSNAPQNLLPSPLLVSPTEFVLVHFQLHPNEIWTSPQNPIGEAASTAARNYGATPRTMQDSTKYLAELKGSIQHEQLLTIVPEQLLPPVEFKHNTLAANYSYNFDNDEYIANRGRQVFNDPGIKRVAEQIENTRNNSIIRDDNPGPQRKQPQQQTATAFPEGGYERQRLELTMRNGLVWQSRVRGINAYAQSSAVQQRAGNQVMPMLPVQLAKEGVSRPFWLGDKLLIARRTLIDKQIVIQGCWLNWPRVKQALLEGMEATLGDDVDLVPVRSDANLSLGRMLATLPVALRITEPAIDDIPVGNSPIVAPPRRRWSAIRASLGVAWACLCLGTVAVAVLLKGVIKLSERRGAFVSAVTHELRTPLTTFRMYAEMLSEGMVSEPQQQQQYLETLRVEADRLSHLVENVLQYARLERQHHGKLRETLTVSQLVDRMKTRLTDRAEQAGLQMQMEMEESVVDWQLQTDPAAVEQIVFNLVDNACKYAVAADDAAVQWNVTAGGTMLQLTVSDRGPGISDKAARKLFKPFSKSVHDAADSAPGVGLGLALSRRLAVALGGQLEYRQREGGGASFTLLLPLPPNSPGTKV